MSQLLLIKTRAFARFKERFDKGKETLAIIAEELNEEHSLECCRCCDLVGKYGSKSDAAKSFMDDGWRYMIDESDEGLACPDCVKVMESNNAN